MVGNSYPKAGTCQKPQQVGYYCTKDEGHSGPCPAHRLPPDSMALLGKESKPEKSGGQTSYYLVDVTNPNQGRFEYTAECGDIIEALGMTFNEGCAFKALWRTAAARTLGKLKEGGDPLYDAQKVEFYGQRMVSEIEHARRKKLSMEGVLNALAGKVQS